jgi:hypothetical protein
MGRFHSFSSLSLKVRHKFSGPRTSKQQTDNKPAPKQQIDTETASSHSNNKPTPKQQTDTETSNQHPNNKPTPNQQASTLLDQTIKMEEMTITHHPSELLNQVAMAMNWRHPEISVSVPMVTTWKTVLRAIDSALGEVDGPIWVHHKRSESRQQKLRQMALQNVKDWSSMSSANTSPGLPIRTQYDIESLPFPKPASEEKRKRLKDEAMSDHHFYEPYAITLHASLTEKTLPVVKGRVELRGVDYVNGDPIELLEQVDMIWDTGAHQTIITEELLSEPFRRFLKDSRHDNYRLSDGLRVQMDGIIGLSNLPVPITAIVIVVPKTVMPNEHIGILFGQKCCINSISYRSIPRRILQAKGENIGEEMWGDIVIDEFVDDIDELHSF